MPRHKHAGHDAMPHPSAPPDGREAPETVSVAAVVLLRLVGFGGMFLVFLGGLATAATWHTPRVSGQMDPRTIPAVILALGLLIAVPCIVAYLRIYKKVLQGTARMP